MTVTFCVYLLGQQPLLFAIPAVYATALVIRNWSGFTEPQRFAWGGLAFIMSARVKVVVASFMQPQAVYL